MEAEVLRALFDSIYDDAHTFLQTKLQTKMILLEALYIRQCIDLLQGLDVGNSNSNSKYKTLSLTESFLHRTSCNFRASNRHFHQAILLVLILYLCIFATCFLHNADFSRVSIAVCVTLSTEIARLHLITGMLLNAMFIESITRVVLCRDIV